MGALCCGRRSSRAHGPCIPTRDRPLEDLSRNIILSVQPPDRCKPCRGRHSQALADREQAPLHYTRDVTLCEDASRIRKNPGVFARMRSFAYNILRINQSDTIAQDRYAAALGGLKSIFSMRFSKER